MSADSKEKTIHFLRKLKENYGYTNKSIAAELDVSEVLVSAWFTGRSKPNPANQEKAWNLFHKAWQSGIVELPPIEGYWVDKYYMRVEDVKNPYETWCENYYTYYELDDFKDMLAASKEKAPQPPVIQYYYDYDEFSRYSRLHEWTFNHTLDLLNYTTADKIFNGIINGKIPAVEISYKILQQQFLKEKEEETARHEAPTTTN